MGRIAPRRRKTTRIYQPLLRTWLNVSQRLKPGAAPTSEGAEPPSEPPSANDKMQQLKALNALKKADSVADLAEAIRVPASALETALAEAKAAQGEGRPDALFSV